MDIRFVSEVGWAVQLGSVGHIGAFLLYEVHLWTTVDEADIRIQTLVGPIFKLTMSAYQEQCAVRKTFAHCS